MKNKNKAINEINKYFKIKGLTKISKIINTKPIYINNIASEISEKNNIKSEKKVTIIITVFNETELLKYAINSIVNQTYKNIEIIIVDDKSTQETKKILEYFNDKYTFIKLIYLKENKGTYIAKNIALQYATGDYITFHDSDDWAHPQRLEEQIKAREVNNSSASISKLVRIKPNGELYSKHIYPLDRMCMISLMIKKEVLEEIGYFMKKRTGADTEYYERVKNFSKNGCVKVDKVLTFCAQRPNSLTTDPKIGVWENGENPKRVNYMNRWRNWHKGYTEAKKTPYVKFDKMEYEYKIGV